MSSETKINHEEIFLKLKALILTLCKKGGSSKFEQGLFNLMENIIGLEKAYLDLTEKVRELEEELKWKNDLAKQQIYII